MKPCYFCKAPCDSDDFCHGCGQFVCEDCAQADRIESPWAARHQPEAHLRLVAEIEGARRN